MNLITYSVLTLISIGFIFSCVDKDQKDSVGRSDASTTPPFNGGELIPAEDGPVRSIFGEPAIDIDTFQLAVTGLVDSSFSLNWEKIQAWPAVSTDTIIMYCVEGWQVWGVWKGIWIKDLLDRARLQTDGEYILVECVEGYKTAFSIAYLEKYKAILAYQVNNFPLQEHDGFPLRLIAFGKFGYKWAKWVRKLEVMNFSQFEDQEIQIYLDPADVPIERRRYFEGEDARPLDY